MPIVHHPSVPDARVLYIYVFFAADFFCDTFGVVAVRILSISEMALLFTSTAALAASSACFCICAFITEQKAYRSVIKVSMACWV